MCIYVSPRTQRAGMTEHTSRAVALLPLTDYNGSSCLPSPPQQERTPLDATLATSLSAGAPPGTYESTYQVSAQTWPGLRGGVGVRVRVRVRVRVTVRVRVRVRVRIRVRVRV